MLAIASASEPRSGDQRQDRFSGRSSLPTVSAVAATADGRPRTPVTGRGVVVTVGAAPPARRAARDAVPHVEAAPDPRSRGVPTGGGGGNVTHVEAADGEPVPKKGGAHRARHVADVSSALRPR